MLQSPAGVEEITELSISKYVQSTYYPQRDVSKMVDHVKRHMKRCRLDRFGAQRSGGS
jgi:hypothetical protein